MKYLLTLILTLTLPQVSYATLPAAVIAASESEQVSITPVVLVVNVTSQTLTQYENGKVVERFVISTATNGVGSEAGSYKTPRGLHRVRERIGSHARPYSIFQGRVFTGRIWDSENRADVDSDLVVSRILWLDGLEHGRNKGRRPDGKLVDSHDRFIYIHGTNHEDRLGVPASRGCIRMSTPDIVRLFPKIPRDSLVWIDG